MPRLSGIDHLVLTVRDLNQTVRFYRDILGMGVERYEAADATIRTALKFGSHKINLHLAGAEFDPKAKMATPGSADLCFITETPLTDWQQKLTRLNVPVLEGPVPRTGAKGRMTSIYIRDPDGNLLEIAQYSETR